MMKNVSPHNHLSPAFSLIELSIVIIILGFLIAGIMSGANMIKVARVNNILTEHRKIKIASNAFLLGRNRLAGDTNRDERIDYSTAVEGTNVNESIHFWRELSEEKLMEGMRYNPPNVLLNGNIVVGTTIPSSKYDKKVGWHAMYIDIDNNNSNISGNALILSGFSNSSLLPLIDSKTAQSIDIKMDDGRPLSGIVYANKNKSDINNVCYTSSTEYNTEDNTKNNRCSIVFGEKSVPDTLVSIEDGVGGEGVEVVDVEELMPEPSGVQVFSYTGAPQEFVVPDRVEKAKLEVWGAKGGSAGGGGYSYGELNVTSRQKLYVYVGGKGIGCRASISNGGWNGGGRCGGGNNIGWSGTSYSGGGGTDVRTISGNWDNLTSLESRIIVAGGGGGSGSKNAGAGGGGNNNGGNGQANSVAGGFGGTAAAGGAAGCSKACHSADSAPPTSGSFGAGGDGGYAPSNISSPDCDAAPGGGGGWYGGGGACQYGASGSGGGGSGHLGSEISKGGGSSGVKADNGVAKICWGDRIGECNGTQP